MIKVVQLKLSESQEETKINKKKLSWKRLVFVGQRLYSIIKGSSVKETQYL